MANVVSVNISERKGEQKHPVPEIQLKFRHGIVGDAHAGDWHRQISLLAEESVDTMRASCPIPLDPGVFAEILQISQYLEGKEVVWGEETVSLGVILDQIGFDGNGDITCGFGDIKVRLGGKELLEGKLREMKDILPQLYGRAGTLYLDTYDENESDPSYIFK